jgi:hypothetical protein
MKVDEPIQCPRGVVRLCDDVGGAGQQSRADPDQQLDK